MGQEPGEVVVEVPLLLRGLQSLGGEKGRGLRLAWAAVEG